MMIEFVINRLMDTASAAGFGAHAAIPDDVEVLGLWPWSAIARVVESPKAFAAATGKTVVSLLSGKMINILRLLKSKYHPRW